MRITVAVCTRNRASLLLQTLERMAHLSIPRGIEWEILVVDNGSTDDTASVASDFAARLPLRRLIEPEPGLSRARNLAVENATGDYVIWTDDDVLVDEDWIEAYHEAFLQFPEAAFFGGPVRPAFATAPPPWIERAWSRVSLYYAMRECGETFHPVTSDYTPFGANLAVRMDVQREHRYDPALGRRGTVLLSGEDWAVLQTILERGGTGWWVPRAAVRHYLTSERLTTRYLRRLMRYQGEASVALDATVGVTEPHSLGRIRKNAVKAEARYRLYRLLRAPDVWVEQLHLASFHRGQLRALRSRRPDAGVHAADDEREQVSNGARRAIRVASWPHWYAPNRYLDLLYAALEPYGIHHVRSVPLEPGALAIPDRRIHVLHLHWPEPFWREGPRSPIGRWWRVARLRRRVRSARRNGVRVIWTVHNLERHEGADWTDRMAYRLLHAHAELRVFTSEWAREAARRTYGGSGDTMVVPIGAFDGVYPPPGARAEVLRRVAASGHEHNLLCFGDVRPYKGFDVALDALNLLPQDRFRLIIAGRPVSRHAETIRAAAAGRPNVTLLLRELTDQELADLLHASDAVLLPYRKITGSAALLTALTLGRGAVVSDLPYFREILGSEPEAGAFVQPDHPDSLARGINRYLTVESTVRAEAARRVAARFAWSEVVKPLADWLVTRVSQP